MSGNGSLPIKMTSGRRLIIQQVTDTASFSARRLSFNAKELKFISDELAKWLSEMYGEEVDSDLPESLISGVVLLTIVEKHLPFLLADKRWHKDAKPMSFQARDNITLFADCCVALGMRRSDVCNYSNFERGDLKQITATLCAFAKLGIPKGLHQVSKELETYVENAYSPGLAQMDIVNEEEEIQLTAEELEALERERQAEEERQQRIAASLRAFAELREECEAAFNRAVEGLCADALSGIDMDELALSEDSDSSKSSKSSKSSDSSKSSKKGSKKGSKRSEGPRELSAEELRGKIAKAEEECELAKRILEEMRKKRAELEAEGADTSEADAAIAEMERKIGELEGMVAKEREELQRKEEEERRRKEEEEERKRREEAEEAERLRREEEERILREEAERLLREEEERKRKEKEEEEERLRKEEEDRLQREEEERKQKEEEERRQKEEEERRQKEEEERKRKEEEEERLRKEEEERKRKEEEERLRKEEEERQKREEAERVQRELEEEQRLEEERARLEEEEQAKKCRGCRSRRPKQTEEGEA